MVKDTLEVIDDKLQVDMCKFIIKLAHWIPEKLTLEHNFQNAINFSIEARELFKRLYK